MEDDYGLQVIDGNGVFNVAGLDRFVKTTRMANCKCGESYAVVSIIGPQSSGKSTLLNHLFGTSFKEMFADEGRSQTTKGIWLAECVDIEPLTIVMDVEGTDGRERGEDDTAFEKQSAVFALALSDILLVNMWCHDVGLEQAANKPLLRTVFQVMMQLFSPRKKTLVFVIRDKTKTSTDKLEEILRKDIQEIWDNVPKPQAHRQTPFHEYCKVEVVALSNYEHQKKLFKEEVASLRRRFYHSMAPAVLAEDRGGIVPAPGFAVNAQEIWKLIKNNKDLHLPSHKVMVSTILCERIADEKLSSLAADTEWLWIERASRHGIVPGFGKKFLAIMYEYISGYEKEVVYFDEVVRASKKEELVSKLYAMLATAADPMVEQIRSNTMDEFLKSFHGVLVTGNYSFAVAARDSIRSSLSTFDSWMREDGASEEIEYSRLPAIRHQLQCDMDLHVASVRDTKLSELTKSYKSYVYKVLAGPVGARLQEANEYTWPAIRTLFQQATWSCQSEFSSALSSFDLDEATTDRMIAELAAYAKAVVRSVAEYAANNALARMEDRFEKSFLFREHSKPRAWKRKKDIRAISEAALYSSLKLLSILAVCRLDDEADDVLNILYRALTDSDFGVQLDSKTWDEVCPNKTLITPSGCNYVWCQFREKADCLIAQAFIAQKKWKRKRNAKIAGVVLGLMVTSLLL